MKEQDTENKNLKDSILEVTGRMFLQYGYSGTTFQKVADEPVSYTHLDVYKRQGLTYVKFFISLPPFPSKLSKSSLVSTDRNSV